MNFDAAAFPLYELLLKLNQPGVETAKADFATAQAGGAKEKCQFAIGLHGIANIPGIEKEMPGFTPAIRQKTLASCLAVFEETGTNGWAQGAQMSAYCYTWGLGAAKDIVKARDWLNKAEDLGTREDPFTQQLRGQLGPRIFCRVKHPPRP